MPRRMTGKARWGCGLQQHAQRGGVCRCVERVRVCKECTVWSVQGCKDVQECAGTF